MGQAAVLTSMVCDISSHNSSLSHARCKRNAAHLRGTRGAPLRSCLDRGVGLESFWLRLIYSGRVELARPLPYVAEDRTAVRVRPRLYTAASSRQYICWLLLPLARAHPGRGRAIGRMPPSSPPEHVPWGGEPRDARYQSLPSISHHVLCGQAPSAWLRSCGGRAPTYPRQPAPDCRRAHLARGISHRSSRTCGPESPKRTARRATARAPARSSSQTTPPTHLACPRASEPAGPGG